MRPIALAGLILILGSTSVDAYLAPGTQVLIAKTMLNFYCMGKGRPIIVLESGLGGRASQWSAVQSALAETSTVCSYDRAGYGFSSPGPEPRTSRAIAAELSEALDALGLRGPYVLVAASYGAFDVRIFARARAADIVGAVLVNPSAEQEELVAANPAIERIDTDGLNDAKACLAAAESRSLAKPGPQTERCIGPPAETPAAKVRQQILKRPNTWRALVSEWSNIKTSAQEVADAGQNFGNRPLVVISAGLEPSYAGMPPDQQAALHEFWARWNRWQDDLAELSTNAYHVRTHSSDRAEERSNPDCVVKAVKAVMVAAAAGSALTDPC
jgi:pimeloyl-ACP methyl ester carboxylesterase